MKTVSNFLFIILIIVFISCNKNKKSINSINSKFKTSYIDFNADSVFNKLSVGFSNEEYYQDEDENLIYLVTREIKILDKNFGGPNSRQDFSKVINYYQDNKNKFKVQNADEIIKIFILKKNGTYDNVWSFENQIFISEDNTYSMLGLNVFLEGSFTDYNGKLQNSLHINFKLNELSNGYELYTLNYTCYKKEWKLVSRERICTIPNEINHHELGYCVDTINYRCKTRGNKFDLSFEDVFSLGNANCNGE